MLALTSRAGVFNGRQELVEVLVVRRSLHDLDLSDATTPSEMGILTDLLYHVFELPLGIDDRRHPRRKCSNCERPTRGFAHTPGR